MGTPAIAKILDEEGKTIVSVFAQCDGFPEDFGNEVIGCLRGRTVVNGIGSDTKLVSNGMTELAAHVVVFLKTASPRGHIYLVPDKSTWAYEYLYVIAPPKIPGFYTGSCDMLDVTVYEAQHPGSRDKKLFSGKVSGYDRFLQSYKAEV